MPLGGYQLVPVKSGAWSLRSQDYAETCHPGVGPVVEAESLYVRHLDLAARAGARPGEFTVWDVGLGGGANALTALRALQGAPVPIRLVSFEHSREPLPFAFAHRDQLGYFAGYEDAVTRLLALPEAAVSELRFTGPGGQQVCWTIHWGDFPALLGSPEAGRLPKPEAILYDAYSSAVNPEMWTLPLFRRLRALLDPGRPCSLATYSRSTLLRSTLLLAGFFVGRGLATGEKEETTVAASVRGLVAAPLDQRWLERARRSHCAEPLAGPPYRRIPLSEPHWQELQAHPQF